MNPWGFFARKICLTLGGDEWLQAKLEFQRVGLNVEQYLAVKEIGPHQSFSHSERNILLEFLFSNHQVLLHLEDDVVFRNHEHLESALSELPEDWDICYLGANLILWGPDEAKAERYSEHLFRIQAAWTTHAVAYNKKCVEFILGRQPSFNAQMFDNAMSHLLPELNAFCIAPMFAYQRPHHSVIWGRYDDYTHIFDASNEKLR